MIDRQKVYNKVRKHLLTQNRRAMEGGFCSYRTYDPKCKKVLKCAVGCLIPFRHYNPDMEGGSVGRMSVDTALAKSIPGYDTGEDTNFLSGLQDIHDQRDPDEWEILLNEFAETHELKVQA